MILGYEDNGAFWRKDFSHLLKSIMKVLLEN